MQDYLWIYPRSRVGRYYLEIQVGGYIYGLKLVCIIYGP